MYDVERPEAHNDSSNITEDVSRSISKIYLHSLNTVESIHSRGCTLLKKLNLAISNDTLPSLSPVSGHISIPLCVVYIYDFVFFFSF